MPDFANYFWVYTIGPWVGGVLAAVLHRGHLMMFSTIKELEGETRLSKLFGDHTTPIAARRVTYSAFKRTKMTEEAA